MFVFAKRKEGSRGFTIAELITVVAIILILLPLLGPVQDGRAIIGWPRRY